MRSAPGSGKAFETPPVGARKPLGRPGGLLAGPALAFALCCLALSPVHAHEGHDHGSPEPAAPVELAPRAAATSELFEVVAVLAPGPRLLLYLDRYASNEPVRGARLEVESGAWRGAAEEIGEGVYAVPAEALRGPGTHPLTLSVEAGGEADLLAASLLVPAPAQATRAAERNWQGWAAGGAALLLGAGLVARAVRRHRRQASMGGGR